MHRLLWLNRFYRLLGTMVHMHVPRGTHVHTGVITGSLGFEGVGGTVTEGPLERW